MDISIPVDHASDPHRLEDAARADAQMQSRYLAFRESLEPADVDVPVVVGKLLEVAERVRAIAACAGSLPDFDVACFDDLEHAALATWFRWVARSNDPHNDPAEVVAALDARAKMNAVVSVAVAQGAIPARKLKRDRSGPTYYDLAHEVLDLVTIARAYREDIAAYWRLTDGDLTSALAAGMRLRMATTLDAERVARIDESERAMTFRQALTLLARTDEQVRRAVRFLRWNEGDADDIAPPLFASGWRESTKVPRGLEDRP